MGSRLPTPSSSLQGPSAGTPTVMAFTPEADAAGVDLNPVGTSSTVADVPGEVEALASSSKTPGCLYCLPL